MKYLIILASFILLFSFSNSHFIQPVFFRNATNCTEGYEVSCYKTKFSKRQCYCKKIIINKNTKPKNYTEEMKCKLGTILRCNSLSGKSGCHCQKINLPIKPTYNSTK